LTVSQPWRRRARDGCGLVRLVAGHVRPQPRPADLLRLLLGHQQSCIQLGDCLCRLLLHTLLHRGAQSGGRLLKPADAPSASVSQTCGGPPAMPQHPTWGYTLLPSQPPVRHAVLHMVTRQVACAPFVDDRKEVLVTDLVELLQPLQHRQCRFCAAQRTCVRVSQPPIIVSFVRQACDRVGAMESWHRRRKRKRKKKKRRRTRRRRRGGGGGGGGGGGRGHETSDGKMMADVLCNCCSCAVAASMSTLSWRFRSRSCASRVLRIFSSCRSRMSLAT
jgi:hypothetical protein